MIIVKGTWHARVDQDFEVEVANESEISAAIEAQMSPRNVVELTDFSFEVEVEIDQDEES